LIRRDSHPTGLVRYSDAVAQTTPRKPVTTNPGPNGKYTGKPLTKKQRRNQAAARSVSVSHRPPWQSPTVVTSVSVGIVAIVLIIIVVINQVGGSGNASKTTPLSATVASVVLHPDPTIIQKVGSGGQSGSLVKLPNTTILKDNTGKPMVVYVGAEYCPFCAAERWTMTMWLSQFGTFKNLTQIESSSTDTDPDTHTFTFYKSSYSSQYINFIPTELEDRNQQPLQSMTTQVNALFTSYDQPPYTTESGQFPFIDIANQYTLYSTSYDPAILAGLTWDQIATKLKNASDPVTIAIVGNANILTAATCIVTQDQPASVCSTPTIQAIEPGVKAIKTPAKA
jgi:hypothetical protein